MSTLAYDETGQTISSIDPCGHTTCTDMPSGPTHTTTYSFSDSYASCGGSAPPSGNTNAHLTQITDPLGHIQKFCYGYNDGQLRGSTDPNNQTTLYKYNDSLGRLTETDYPDGGKATLAYNDSPYSPSTPSPSVTTTKAMTSSTNLTTLTAFDGLGHTVRSVLTSDPDCASGDRTDMTYDGLGHVYAVSTSYCTTSDPIYGVATYTYDALGRTKKVTNPDNSTVLTTYAGRATQVQDESGVTRILQSDALGRLTLVCEVAPGPFVGAGGASSSSLIGSGGTPASCSLDISGTGFLATHQYDALDNLVRVHQGGIADRVFTYDSFSRLIGATNPESGTITYTYDANGNMLSKVAPAPNQTGSATVTTNFTYDALNRIMSKTYSDGTTPFYFLYDGGWGKGPAQNPIGRLVATQPNNNFSNIVAPLIVYAYDPMGRISSKEVCPGSGCFTAAYTYDLAGNMISYGDFYFSTVNQTFNPAGRIIAGGGLTNATYDAAGHIIADTLADGQTETFTYDRRLRLQASSASYNSTPVYSFNISSFAPNGDVLTVSDSINGNWTYTYDQFNRLVGANQNSGAAVYSYVYDRFGNRWQQNGPHSFVATFTGNNPSSPQNNNRMDGYSYDTAGNLLNDGTHTYTYDAENRIVSVDSGKTATYGYDEEGNRVSRSGVTADTCSTTNSTYYYSFDLSGHRILESNTNGTACNYEWWVGDRHMAHYQGGNTYSHTDWLGTERLRGYVLNGSISTSSTDNCISLPFGDAMSCTMSPTNYESTYHFTGQQRDYESNLDFFGARHYSSSMGRFMSPDEPLLDQHASAPQSWNLYSYVQNNPVNYTDPDGEACVSTDGSPYHDDNSGGQSCKDAQVTQKVLVSAQPGSGISSFFLNLSISLSNHANDYFRPVTNLMGIEPSYMQDIPTSAGGMGGIGAGVGTAATYFIGPEAEGINITVEGLEHIMERHVVGGAKTLGKSLFNVGEDVKALLKAAESVSPVRQAGGTFERVVDAGRVIGTDRATGAPTSTYTVITRPNGDLVTAFPGKR